MFQTENKTAKMEELETKCAKLDREIKDAQLSRFPSTYKPLRNAISRRSRIKKQWMAEWMSIDRPATVDEALKQLGEIWFAGVVH